LSQSKLFLTTIILSVAVLVSTFLAGCTSQPVEVRNATEARDVGLSYLDDKYDDNVPAKDLEWKEYMTTAEELVGSGTKQFISGEWLITISYPIVLPENTVYNIVVLNIETGWHWEGSVSFDGTVIEIDTLKQLSKDASRNIALEFIKQSPTFVFDGIEDTLKFTNDIAISIPFTWTFVFQFDSAHAGYGDRTEGMLAQVITPHEVSVTIEQGEIVYASMDNKWNMINQMELDGVDPNDVIVLEESDITGSITDIDSINSDTIDGRILVELEQPNNTSDKFWVTIEKNTPIYKFDGQDHYTVTFDSLQNGQIVEVWFSGPVMESYPAQVDASRVDIMDLN